MSWFDKHGNSLIGSAGSLIGGIVSYFGNKSLQRESNEFNAQQAELNRQFQHQETELARDWQEKFYNQYQSPEAMVRQYENAGINPVLVAGQATNTPPAASGGAGSTASAVTPPYVNMVGVMEQVGKLAMLKAEIANINADTDLKGAQAGAADASAALSRSSVLLNEQNIAESRSRVSKLIAETKSEELKQGLIAAQQLLAETQSSLNKQQTTNLTFDQFEKEMRVKFMNDFKTLPSSNLFESVWNLIFMGKNWIQDLIK